MPISAATAMLSANRRAARTWSPCIRAAWARSPRVTAMPNGYSIRRWRARASSSSGTASATSPIMSRVSPSSASAMASQDVTPVVRSSDTASS